MANPFARAIRRRVCFSSKLLGVRARGVPTCVRPVTTCVTCMARFYRMPRHLLALSSSLTLERCQPFPSSLVWLSPLAISKRLLLGPCPSCLPGHACLLVVVYCSRCMIALRVVDGALLARALRTLWCVSGNWRVWACWFLAWAATTFHPSLFS